MRKKREHKNLEDDYKVRIKRNGDEVKHAKTRKDTITGNQSNKKGKLIKDKDGQFKAKRKQDLIH